MPDAGVKTHSETIMAFDFGERRIGVAIGETLLGQARALATVAESANDRRFNAIGKLIETWQPGRLVVGLPRHVDASAHEFAARCSTLCAPAGRPLPAACRAGRRTLLFLHGGSADDGR